MKYYRQQGNALGKATTMLLVLFFIIYAGFQTYRFFFDTYKTENAYSFEVARSYTTSGLLIREERVIDLPKTAGVRYTLPEGGKFVNTTPVAMQYSGEEMALMADRSQVLEQERDILLDVERGTSSTIKPDIASLSSNVYITLRDLTTVSNLGYVRDVEPIRQGLIKNISHIQATVDQSLRFTQRIGELDTQIAQSEAGTVIQVADSGYFSRFSDGCEGQFTPALLDTITIPQLTELTDKEYPHNTATFGKCITSYDWYYVTTIPLKEAELFQPDTKMTLDFVGSVDGVPLSGWVKSITEDTATGQALLVIQSSDVSADSVSRRTATVKLGFEDYRGIRFSKKALRILDGVKGVYVRGKSAIEFKKVDIIYTGTDFYLSRLDYNSKVYLNIFDEIIVEGTNLHAGKPLE